MRLPSSVLSNAPRHGAGNRWRKLADDHRDRARRCNDAGSGLNVNQRAAQIDRTRAITRSDIALLDDACIGQVRHDHREAARTEAQLPLLPRIEATTGRKSV